MEVPVSKGFLVFAKNTKTVDYVQQAYALALSIKFSQKDVTSISIVTDDKVPKKYQKVFDNIIPIPWNTDDANSTYMAEHRWKLYHVSPYEETIVLDTDMLVLEDLTRWWYYCKDYDLKFCSRILNHKLEPVIDTVHRKTFIANNLTNTYVALHYFKKSDYAHNFYKVLEFVINNWEWCFSKFAPEQYQNWLSFDLAVAITTEIVGAHQDVLDPYGPLEFVHMKPAIQGWSSVPLSWLDGVSSVLNSRGELVVGNIKQSKIFHYVDKQFLTKKLVRQLEELANGKEE